MFDRSARFYDRLYYFKDYAAAASDLRGLILETVPHAQTLLDVACGTGRHLEHLKAHYQAEGLDINPELLEAARRRCPDIPLHQGDMTTFALTRRFDVVTCLFSSIAYVKTPENLSATMANFARHTNPGGAVFLEPYFTPDRYRVDEVTLNVVDQPPEKIAWMYVSRRVGDLGVLDMHYLVGTPEGVEHFCEHHEVGLFTERQYTDAFIDAGMAVTYDPKGPFGRGIYIGRRPDDAGPMR